MDNKTLDKVYLLVSGRTHGKFWLHHLSPWCRSSLDQGHSGRKWGSHRQASPEEGQSSIPPVWMGGWVVGLHLWSKAETKKRHKWAPDDCLWKHVLWQFWKGQCQHTYPDTDTHTRLLRVQQALCFFTMQKTNLQRQGEFTPLLIDPAALIDKSIDGNKTFAVQTHTRGTWPINHAVTHLQLLNDFKQLCVLSRQTEMLQLQRKGRRNTKEEEEHNGFRHKWTLPTNTGPCCRKYMNQRRMVNIVVSPSGCCWKKWRACSHWQESPGYPASCPLWSQVCSNRFIHAQQHSTVCHFSLSSYNKAQFEQKDT